MFHLFNNNRKNNNTNFNNRNANKSFYNLIILIVLNLIIPIKTSLPSLTNDKSSYSCIINNVKYRNEYLYASFDQDMSSLINNNNNNSHLDLVKYRKLYTNELNSPNILRNKQLFWSIEPADPEYHSNNNINNDSNDNNNNIETIDEYYSERLYYITNYLFKNEYLCAMSLESESSEKRHIGLIKMDMFDDEETFDPRKCLWKLDHIPVDVVTAADSNVVESKSNNNNNNADRDNNYMIWNIYYQEPIYAASFHFDNNKRNSFPRNVFTWNRQTASQQSIWNLICKTK